MNDADALTKGHNPGDAESGIDGYGLRISDADATLDAPAPVDSPAASSAANSRSIGPYRLVRKLGEGGMGQVWLAQQTAPLQRHVALKLIRAGMYDDNLLHRFLAERQSLAIMDHPSIAKVFDAGATPDGQPYFVMEYVPGERITTYCDKKRLGIRERLELFIKVCEGVQHAHQKAIIHRDLKPANILVVEVDGKPTPRIIDFGLAKAAGPRETEETMLTEAAGFVGTRGFMSPEQADPGAQDVDTRTDVYSLAVVLYVLLTGTLPFDVEQQKRQPFEEVLRQLREEDPKCPSKKVGSEKETAIAAAERRGTEPKQLASLLRGDLDWITMKALERNRARRYGMPSELAADLHRYLNHEPIVARAASAGYRLQKYVRRHRAGVAVVGAVVGLLIAFAGVQTVQLRRITRERDRATRERDRANRITDFMAAMFKVSDPSEALGNSITAREILDKASKDVDAGLAKDPELQAQMMHVMGTVYQSLGLYPKADLLLTHAIGIRTRILGLEHADTLMSMNSLALVLDNEGHYAEAEKVGRKTLDVRRRVLGLEHHDTLISMDMLGNILRDESRYPEAEKLERETLDIERRVLGPEHSDTLKSMNDLCMVLNHEARYADAEKLARETLEIERRVLGLEHPDTLRTMDRLATAVDQLGHHVEAEKLARETLEIERRVLGPEHALTLQTMNNLADTLISEGHEAEAETVLRQMRDIQRRVLGPEHPLTAISTYNLAVIAARRGHRDEAFSLLRDAIDHGLPGYGDLAMDKDPDLKPLYGDSRFDSLLAHARQRAGAAQKPN